MIYLIIIYYKYLDLLEFYNNNKILDYKIIKILLNLEREELYYMDHINLP